MARLRGHRGLGFLVAVVLTASGAARAPCFMPGTGEAGPRDAHACCKKGWTERPPACCMAGAAGEDPARTVASATLSAPPAMIDAVTPPPPATRAHAALAAGTRSHSPPGLRPLRI